jgi:SAM-dependent methyltransferase/predicted O-methyltransferase YrrM
MSYDATIYQGAAAHYRLGRPAYSPQLEAVLTQELNLDGSGRLLDGGCGPGILTARLAHLFEEAVGLDPDPAMLAEGRKAADELGITNIRWVQALAEELPDAAPGPYRLVTFGQSFHWTDEARVAEAVYDMLEPGGALALIVHTVEGRPAPASPGPPPIPHAEIRGLVEKYLGSTKRVGQGIAPVRTHRFEDVLVGTRFGTPRSIFAPGIADLVRDSESVLSGYFSMATSAPHLFGDRVEDFAGEVRELLASRSPEGVFWDWPGDTEVIIACRRDSYSQQSNSASSLSTTSEVESTPELVGAVREMRANLARVGPEVVRSEGDFSRVALPNADADVLRDLLLQEEAEVVLEIGLAYGVSALAIAEALISHGKRRAAHLIIDAFQDRFHDAGWKAIETAGLGAVCSLLRERSQLALPRLLGEGLVADVAFVDGSHIFHNVFVDLFYLREIVRPGGLVILDDCEWPSVATAVRYFELNTGWEPYPLETTTRLRAYRLPDPLVEPTFESFAPFGDRAGS